MGPNMTRTFVFCVLAFAAVVLASEVEDLGAQPVAAKASLGEATKAKARSGVGFSGALMTSGSFTMMAATGADEERRARRERDELGEANDWDLTNGGQCDESEEAWVLTDAKDHSLGKCVKFAADSKCAPQCYHQGNAVDETEEGAVCTKICRVPGSNGAMCNVIKMVMPTYEHNEELGEGKTMYLTKSKVMQAGLTKDNLGEADPTACTGVATKRRKSL